MKNSYYIHDNQYLIEGGGLFQREEGQTPNGNELLGKWVLRDDKGMMVDFDKYRHDLAERHGIRLED